MKRKKKTQTNGKICMKIKSDLLINTKQNEKAKPLKVTRATVVMYQSKSVYMGPKKLRKVHKPQSHMAK